MNELLRPALLILVPALNAVGLYIKGKKVVDENGKDTYPNQKIKGNMIPLVLLGLAVLFCVVDNLTSSGLLGWRLVVHSLSTGAMEGLVCTGVAVFGYDMVKGVAKRVDKD